MTNMPGSVAIHTVAALCDYRMGTFIDVKKKIEDTEARTNVYSYNKSRLNKS